MNGKMLFNSTDSQNFLCGNLKGGMTYIFQYVITKKSKSIFYFRNEKQHFLNRIVEKLVR